MNKMNRTIDHIKMEQSKQRTMASVMTRIEEDKKPLFQFKLKYTLAPFILIIVLVLVLFKPGEIINPNPNPTVLGEYESVTLAEVGYISGSLIAQSFELSNNSLFLSTSFMATPSDMTELETSMFNEYFDMLKVFLDDGINDSIDIVESDLEEYQNKIVFSADDNEFVLYINLVEEDLTGIMYVNDTEYTVDGSFKQDNEEIELDITAYAGANYLEISYKVESKDEIERKYEIKQYIDGILYEKEIKMELADDEMKVELSENSDSYQLKKELEDGEDMYKLEYTVDGVSGEAKIYVIHNNDGSTTYSYVIDEEDKHKEIELDDPDEEDED